MPANQLTDDALRSLAEVEADEPVVVSLFLDLDPAEFAIAPARDTQITSLLSQLDALIGDDGLSRDAMKALELDRERLEAFLRDDDPRRERGGRPGDLLLPSARRVRRDQAAEPRRQGG